jgi:enhancing lycopene biosynthesis protein 2
VLEESARIARGNCKDMKDLKAKYYDALIIPGGFGAAKNLSDFAFKGIDMSVKDDVARVLVDFNTHGKVIGMTCISPILVAKLFGNKNPKLTLGKRASNFPFQGAMDCAESFGCQLDA